MAEQFNFSVKAEPSGSAKYRLKVAQFGDGYMQVSGDGINVVRKSWSLRHFGAKNAAQCTGLVLSKNVSDFLDRNAGKPILWTDPDGYTSEWICLAGWNSTEEGNTRTISFNFEEFN